MKKKSYKFGIIAVIAIIAIIGVIAFILNTASVQRGIKSLSSELNGGLDRTVTVYDYNGEPIDSWSGKFDVTESENEVYFDIDGKRVIIHGGIVINEEN